jgi:hypothetical protein
MATKDDGEISDGEVESSEDEGVATIGNNNKKQLLTQYSEPYTLFTSNRVVKGTW